MSSVVERSEFRRDRRSLLRVIRAALTQFQLPRVQEDGLAALHAVLIAAVSDSRRRTA